MELYKNKENHKYPVKTAKSNFIALAVLYVLLGILFFGTRPEISYTFLTLAVFLVIASYFLGKRKMVGIYLGWVFVILGIGGSIFNKNILSLLIVCYLAYWNYKAWKDLKQQLPNTTN